MGADSWKLDLIQAINEALEYAVDRESFIENMEYEGYEVTWMDTRKHITFTCPNGRKCRDSSLHDETILKENLEVLFAYRQAVGFCPGSAEPDEGWMGEVTSGLIQLGRAMTCHHFPRRLPGQTASSADVRPSRRWLWGRNSAATRTKIGR